MGYLSNSPFQISSGTWKISTSTIKGSVIKCIQNVVAGVLYLDTTKLQQLTTELSYGTWSFYIQHADASNTQVIFIGDTIGAKNATGQDGYYFDISNAEVVALGESVNGTPTDKVTNASGIIAGEWTKFKITRNASGLFTLYKNDNLLGSTFTDTTATTSNYICLSFDAGDLFSLGDKSGNYNFSKKLLT